MPLKNSSDGTNKIKTPRRSAAKTVDAKRKTSNEDYQRQRADEIVFPKGAPDEAEPQTVEDEIERAERLEAAFHGMTLPNREQARVGAPGCQRCEVLPAPLRGPGTLVLRFPHTHTLGKVLGFLATSAYQHAEENGSVKVTAPTGSLAPLLTPILNLMSPIEQRDTRAVFQTGAQIISETSFWEIEALPDFVNRASSEWLLEILREKRLFSAFQPIMQIEKPNGARSSPRLYGYECLMRAELDGEKFAPTQILEAARETKMLFQLDLAARRAAITGAAQHRIKEKVFVNFAPNSIYNPHNCLRSTVEMINELGFKSDQIVFEIIESERLPEIKHLRGIVEYYRENGFCVALDDVGAGFASLSLLLELRPDFVKLDMNLVRGVHRDTAKALVTRKLLETAQELGLQTIAEGIETADELEWVTNHGADFAQGYYFARPAVPPPLV